MTFVGMEPWMFSPFQLVLLLYLMLSFCFFVTCAL